MKIFLFALVAYSLSATMAVSDQYYALTSEAAGRYLSETLAGNGHSFQPANGAVPDKETAIAIAVAVWNPIYGAKKIANERPYQAVLVDKYWVVTGSLPAGLPGGTAEIVISQKDAQIVRISHGK